MFKFALNDGTDDDDDWGDVMHSLDGGVDRLTMTRLIYDKTYGQWDGTSFTAPTEGLYEFTIRMVGISEKDEKDRQLFAYSPPMILPELNGLIIDDWWCKIYGYADCQKTFQGNVTSMGENDLIPP